MKLRDRVVVNYKGATKKVPIDENTANTTPPNKPTPHINRRRKSAATATVAARAIERMKLLKYGTTPAPSGLKIRLRRDVPVPINNVGVVTTPSSSPITPIKSADQPSRRLLKPKDTSTVIPTNQELKELADILASFIAEGGSSAVASPTTCTGVSTAVLIPRSSIRLSAPPTLSGVPSLAFQLPQIPIKEEPSELACHSPPFSPCESSPASTSPPSSPRHESCPSSPPFEASKDERVPIEQRSTKDRGVKRKRTRTTQAQLMVLEAIFEEDKTPCKARRDEIGAQLSMTSRAVQVWFQNRRSKMKKLGFKAEQPPTPLPTAAQEAVQKVLAPLPTRPTAVPPSLPVFTPLSSPLPLPQIQSVDLLPPVTTQRPTLLRKPRTTSPDPVDHSQQQTSQQVFILPKMTIPIPSSITTTPIPVTSSLTTTAIATTTTTPARKSTKRLAKRTKLTESKSTTEEVKPLQSMVVVAQPVPVQPTLAPRPMKVVMKAPHAVDFSRATLVPVSAHN